jgi:hypothetical protein
MSGGRSERVSWAEIDQFLRAVARVHLREIDVETVLRFHFKQVPWNSVLALAEMEGITGFLYRHRHSFSAGASEAILSKLAFRYEAIRTHTTGLMEEVGRIAARLEHAGMTVLALQGLSLLPLYKDKCLRPLGDVDLLVAADQKGDFIRLLVECGFAPATGHYPELLRKENLCIDIHTHILDRLHCLQALFPTQFIRVLRQRSAPLYGRCIRVADPIDNLLALCAHALKHGYSRLIWLTDLHESLLALETTTPNLWDEIYVRARAWRQEKPLLYALLLLESVFGLAVPTAVKKTLGLARLGCVEKYMLRLRARGFRSQYLPHVLYLHMTDGATAKADFLREALYPEAATISQVLQDRHWKRGFAGYLRRLISTGVQAAADLKRAVGCRPCP